MREFGDSQSNENLHLSYNFIESEIIQASLFVGNGVKCCKKKIKNIYIYINKYCYFETEAKWMSSMSIRHECDLSLWQLFCVSAM